MTPLAKWDYLRKAKLKQLSEMIRSDRFMPHRLAAVVEVNPGGRSSINIIGEESAIDQTPEVDYAANDIRDLTNIAMSSSLSPAGC